MINKIEQLIQQHYPNSVEATQYPKIERVESTEIEKTLS